MIKGCIGFSHVKGHFFGNMILVRGKRTIDIKLPYPIMCIMSRLWRRKNFLGKILFRKSMDLDQFKTRQTYGPSTLEIS